MRIHGRLWLQGETDGRSLQEKMSEGPQLNTASFLLKTVTVRGVQGRVYVMLAAVTQIQHLKGKAVGRSHLETRPRRRLTVNVFVSAKL